MRLPGGRLVVTRTSLWVHFLYLSLFSLHTIHSGYRVISIRNDYSYVGPNNLHLDDATNTVLDQSRSKSFSSSLYDQGQVQLRIPERREDRFPTVDERVRMYMSDWYVPPCENYTDGFTQYNPHYWDDDMVLVGNEWQKPTGLKRKAVLAELFAGYPEEFLHCKEEKTFLQYTKDVVEHILPAMSRIGWTNDTDAVPLLIQYGDQKKSKKLGYMNLPHIKKFRSSYTKEEISKITAPECHHLPRPNRNRELEAIIMKLNSGRHYSMLEGIPSEDIPWTDKKNMAVFRGKKTGPHEPFGFPGEVTRCFEFPRCRLVYQNLNSTRVDAILTGRTEATFGGVTVLGSPLTIQQQLEYKAIIMVEGIDTATGLKWALYSNSVVMMPPVTKSTWMMEELLEPWVHFIPIDNSFTDLEAKMQWIIDHDAQAQMIAKRGSLWIKDLLYHQDSQRDNDLVEEEILRRYLKHFRLNKELDKNYSKPLLMRSEMV